MEDHSYFVSEVLDEWYGPEHLFFTVRADDGNVYMLQHDTSVPDGEWELVSFRSEISLRFQLSDYPTQIGHRFSLG